MVCITALHRRATAAVELQLLRAPAAHREHRVGCCTAWVNKVQMWQAKNDGHCSAASTVACDQRAAASAHDVSCELDTTMHANRPPKQPASILKQSAPLTGTEHHMAASMQGGTLWHRVCAGQRHACERTHTAARGMRHMVQKRQAVAQHKRQPHSQPHDGASAPRTVPSQHSSCSSTQ